MTEDEAFEWYQLRQFEKDPDPAKDDEAWKVITMALRELQVRRAKSFAELPHLVVHVRKNESGSYDAALFRWDGDRLALYGLPDYAFTASEWKTVMLGLSRLLKQGPPQ